MRLIQLVDDAGEARVGMIDQDGARVRLLRSSRTTYALATTAIAANRDLEQQVAQEQGDESFDYATLLREDRVLTPLAHPDPAHLRVTGTGLTHLGSAATRDAMHQNLQDHANAGSLTDSMKVFQWGVEGGIPRQGRPGAQPEWFYKGDGSMVIAPGQALPSPDFALDGGEEPELVGLYLIGPDGTPHRLGFALGNEFSDHITERQNYLYLAHSKLRACAVGPELRTGPLPRDLSGTSRIRRGDTVLWEKTFLTGEDNICHSLENLEYHHFKYAAHRRPGDVHLHFFGTSTLSFADGIAVQPGDCFEIDLPALGAPLVNPLQTVAAGFALGGVQPL